MYKEIIYSLDELPIPEWVVEELENLPYQFGYALVFDDYATLCTESGYRYEVVDF